MADGVEVKIDATQATLKLERLPAAVRDKLRTVLPPLVRQIAALVDSNLASGLKSRKTLTTNQEIRENAKGITGVVSVTSPSAQGLLPHYLEEGTMPHHIIAGGETLAFEWPNAPPAVAAMFPKTFPLVFFVGVTHPGFAGIHYMQNAFDQMQNEIIDTLQEAASDAARGVR